MGRHKQHDVLGTPGDRGAGIVCSLCNVNRCFLTTITRPQAFAKMFGSTPDDLDMHVVYDVSHNIAKVGASWLAAAESCDWMGSMLDCMTTAKLSHRSTSQ